MGENTVLVLFATTPVLMGFLLFVLTRRNQKRVSKKKRKTSWASLVLGNSAVLVFLLSLGLLSGEVYFRFFQDTTDSINFSRVSRRWFSRYWNTRNGLGCRDNVNYYQPVGPGKRRVSFLGDSFTAGQGIKNIEDRFVNRIRSRRPDWEIHMLADLGWDTDSELDFLKYEVAQNYQFDNVVLVFCLNDVSDLMPHWMDSVRSAEEDIRHSGWLIQNSYFVNFLYSHWQIMRNPSRRIITALLATDFAEKFGTKKLNYCANCAT